MRNRARLRGRNNNGDARLQMFCPIKEGELEMKNANDLTREETIKALRVCSTAGRSCKLCPLRGPWLPGISCFDALKARAAELLGEASHE